MRKITNNNQSQRLGEWEVTLDNGVITLHYYLCRVVGKIEMDYTELNNLVKLVGDFERRLYSEYADMSLVDMIPDEDVSSTS